MPWDFIVILIILAVVVPWRGAARMRKLLAQPQLSSADRLSLYASTLILQWVAAGFVLWRALERHIDPSQLALTFGRARISIPVGLGLAVLVIANQLASIRRLAQLPPEKRGFLGQMSRKIMPQNAVEQLVFFALVLTVSVCEEFIYRGFIQAVFQRVSGNSVLVGILVSSIFFATAHLYQGKRGVVTTFAVGMVFSSLRVWTGSLAPLAVAHFAADFTAGLAAGRLLRAAPSPASTEGAAAATWSANRGGPSGSN